MNKNCKMTIGAMLLLTTAFSAFSVNAQTCAVPPTCESLGYDKSADECSGLAQLKCPFDQSKYFCTAYRNAGEGEPIAVGDIAYSDGTYSAVPIPTKIPVGVVYSTSGQIVALSPQKTSGIDCLYNVTGTECSSYTANNKGEWTNPTKEELETIYANKNKIEATLATLSATSLETGNYVYGNQNNDPIAISFSTGKVVSFSGCSLQGVIRCVNTLAKIAGGTTPTTTYKVGDTYVKDGVALGTVVSVDSTGQHGKLAISRGSTTSTSEASTLCNGMTAGGAIWGLASCPHACQITPGGTFYTSDCGYCSCVGTSDYCYSGSSSGSKGVVCSAPF